MPGFDGTGPMGGGPMTGGARGYCATGEAPAANYGYGRGLGLARGFRGGRGPGRGFGRTMAGRFAPASPVNPAVEADSVSALANRAETLKRELDEINARLAALEKE